MTKAERQLLEELKDFFEERYDKDWEKKFLKYTKTLVDDGHIDQEIIDEFLDDTIERADGIVKKFKKFLKSTNVTPSRNLSTSTPSSDPCGSSLISGCGSSSSSRSVGGCGSSSSSRGGC